MGLLHPHVEQFSIPLYSHCREVETLTQEDRDINEWLHFLRYHYKRIRARCNKKLRPTRIREREMKKGLLAAFMMLMTTCTLQAQETPQKQKITDDEPKSVEFNLDIRFSFVENTYLNMTYGMGIAVRLDPSIPLYVITGLEYQMSSGEIEILGKTQTTSSRTLSVPLSTAYFLDMGESANHWKLMLQAGARFNYLISSKIGGDSVLDDDNRTGFNGLVRLGIGKSMILYGEYAFSFSGSGDGVWSIGICTGF